MENLKTGLARVSSWLGWLWGVALDFLFPCKCVGCGGEGSLLCPACRAALPRITPPLCARCGRPLASGERCPDCQGWLALDGVRAPFRFEGPVRQAVHEFKYRGVRVLAGPLAGLVSDYAAAQRLPAGVLVPVPTSRRRRRERGFNPAGLLARALAARLQLPVVSDCLVRTGDTPPQARAVSLEERRRNVSRAFTCQDGRLSGQPVLLVDDVVTSGATMDACAVALKAAGAASVWGLALAREV